MIASLISKFRINLIITKQKFDTIGNHRYFNYRNNPHICRAYSVNFCKRQTCSIVCHVRSCIRNIVELDSFRRFGWWYASKVREGQDRKNGGRAFFRTEYKNHLDKTVNPIIKPLLQNPEICFESMYALDDDQKNTLKSHLYTYQEKNLENTRLLIFYKWAVEATKSFPTNRRALLDEIRRIKSVLYDAKTSYPDVDLKVFEMGLRLPKPLDDILCEMPIVTDFTKNLNLYVSSFDYSYQMDVTPYTIKIDYNIFVKSSSKETIQRIYDDMYLHILKADKIHEKIRSAESTVEMCNKKIFQMLKNISSTIDGGTPLIGICNGCKLFIPEDKEKFENRLDIYNKKKSSDESEWFDWDYFKHEDD